MTLMSKCGRCEYLYDAPDVKDGMCVGCRREVEFSKFARECGLEMFPPPDGERYLYDLDGAVAGKLVEFPEFVNDLWDALCRAKGREDLKIGD